MQAFININLSLVFVGFLVIFIITIINAEESLKSQEESLCFWILHEVTLLCRLA